MGHLTFLLTEKQDKQSIKTKNMENTNGKNRRKYCEGIYNDK